MVTWLPTYSLLLIATCEPLRIVLHHIHMDINGKLGLTRREIRRSRGKKAILSDFSAYSAD